MACRCDDLAADFDAGATRPAALRQQPAPLPAGHGAVVVELPAAGQHQAAATGAAPDDAVGEFGRRLGVAGHAPWHAHGVSGDLPRP
ncbi:hypothetical protein G6F59_017536 [Rhizopus arrhizus]|nr:hypothetical protein G6F59_017536 [Rhizopus arrhizus]